MSTRLRVFLFLIVVLSNQAFGQSYWRGTVSSSWSNASNWSTAAVPTSSTDVIFDNSGLVDCNIDANAVCKTLTVNSTYTKTITQTSNFTLVIGTSAVSGSYAVWSGGTFVGGNKDITVNGTFTLNGTNFTSTTTNLKIGDDITFNSGTFAHNNGTLAFNHTLLSKNITFTDNIGVTLYDVTNGGEFGRVLTFANSTSGGSPYTISHNFSISAFAGTHTVSVSSASYPVSVSGVLTTKGTQPLTFSGNSINVYGDLSITNTGAGGGGTATINIVGSGTQTLSSSNAAINLGNLPNVKINKSGQLNLSGFITCAGTSWTYSSGTIAPGTSTVGFYGTPLTVSGTQTLNDVVFYGGYSTFTVANDLTANNVTLDATNRCDITISSSITCNGTLTYANASGYVLLNTGTFNVKGNIVNNNTNTSNGGGTASFIINGTSSQSITGTAATDQGAYPPFTINKSSGTLSFSNFLTFYNGFKWLAGTVSPGSSTCVFYDVVAAAQTIDASGMQFNNVIFKQPDYHPTNVISDLTIAGAMTINASSGVNMNNHNLTLGGNFTNNNTTASGLSYAFNIGTGTVTLNGSSQQSITVNNPSASSNLPIFYSLVVNNTAARSTNDDIVLNDVLRVSNSITFTNGRIYTTSSNYLYLLNGCSSNTGTSTSYVNGPMSIDMALNGSRTLNFAIGDADQWRYITLTLAHNAATSYTYTAKVIHSPASGLGYTTPSTISYVSAIRYTQIGRNLTGGAASNANLNGNQQVTIYYGADDLVNDHTNLTIAQSTGIASPWVDIGGSATADGTGTVTSTSSPTAFASFNSYFTLANNSSGANDLPITLVDFHVVGTNSMIELFWETDSEINNYGFEIQKSANGSNFESIDFVKGQGTTHKKTNYKFIDPNPSFGRSYYRLKQIDLDSKYTYSEVVSLNSSCQVSVVFPNPTSSSAICLSSSAIQPGAIVEIRDLSGDIVYKLTIDQSEQKITLPNVPHVESGLYLLRICSGVSCMESKLVIVN